MTPHAYTTVPLAATHAEMQTPNGQPFCADTAAPTSLADTLEVGDLVFIRVKGAFREIAFVTHSWTNHVGIVVDTQGNEPLIGESKVPFSCFTPLSRFIARSEHRRIAAGRLNRALTRTEQEQIRMAAQRRTGIFYDTGFNLFSRRQFCSRYVREVLNEAIGVEVGEVQSFNDLYVQHPDAPQRFWRLWFLGRIPWNRKTVTPASLLRSPCMHLFFDQMQSGIENSPSNLLHS